MKIGKFAYIICACLSFLCLSCSEEDSTTASSVDPKINLDKQDLSFQVSGGAELINIESNVNDLKVVSGADWCTAVLEGKKLTITVSENEKADVRKALVKIIAASGDKFTSEEIFIAQLSADATITVYPDELSFSKDGEAKSVKVTSNSDDWTAIVPEKDIFWCTAVHSENDSLRIVVGKSYINEPRETEIILSAKGKTATFKVKQEAGELAAFIIPSMASISSVPSEGGKYHLVIGTNVASNYTIKTSSTWVICEKVQDGNSLDVTVLENTKPISRNDTITLSYKGEIGEASVKIPVQQLAFISSFTSVEIPLKAETKEAGFATLIANGYAPKGQEDKDRGPAKFMLDGLFNTFYQSDFNASPFPNATANWFTIELEDAISAFQFWYHNRQDNANGKIKVLNIYVGDDGTSWKLVKTIDSGLPVKRGNTEGTDQDAQYTSPWIELEAPAKWIKFLVTDTQTETGGSSTPYSIAEFKLWKGI